MNLQLHPPADTQLENLVEPFELGLVLDHSDSMNCVASTTVVAVNTLLEEQRKLKAAATKVSLLLFNQSCEIVFDGCPLAMAPDLSPSIYYPSGSTALWDGMGTMIETIGARFDQTPANPSRVLIATITDGEENVSRRYDLQQLREAIAYRQNVCDWRFILISPKAAALAFKLGIPVANTSRWEVDSEKLRALLERVSRTISAYRLGDSKAMLALRG